MKISKNISFKEATRSSTAIRKGISNEPNGDELESMQLVAEKIFQPLREKFGAIRVNSFFRCSALNVAVGGSKSSQHCKGEAVDVDALNGVTNKELFNYIKDNLEFDQLIWEYGTDKEPDWVHFSFTDKRENRKQVLKAVKGQGYLIY